MELIVAWNVDGALEAQRALQETYNDLYVFEMRFSKCRMGGSEFENTHSTNQS